MKISIRFVRLFVRSNRYYDYYYYDYEIMSLNRSKISAIEDNCYGINKQQQVFELYNPKNWSKAIENTLELENGKKYKEQKNSNRLRRYFTYR